MYALYRKHQSNSKCTLYTENIRATLNVRYIPKHQSNCKCTLYPENIRALIAAIQWNTF